MKSSKFFKSILIPLLYILVGAVLGLFMVSLIRLPKTSFDVIAILEAALAFVIGGLTIVGALLVINTWNDIDERAEKIMNKHREEINKKFEQAQKEYDRNSNEAIKKIEEQKEEMKTVKEDIERAKNDINGMFSSINKIYDALNGSPF